MLEMCTAALLALTMNVWHEARGEGDVGMQAVADTTIMRVNSDHYPDCATEVILQPKQFSWVKEKKVKDIGDLLELERSVLHSKQLSERDLHTYRKAQTIAQKALQEGYKPRYKFTHFHTTKVSPPWSKNNKSVKIGNHIFYRNVK